MKYPKMILFDYGHTLLYEPDWDSARGNAALLKYATNNPNNCTAEDVQKGAALIFGRHIESVRKIGYDIGGQVGNRVLYESLGIDFSLSPVEMETIFWDAACPGAAMPGAGAMLNYINKNRIRSAVISNLLWSGAALTQRFNRLLPNHQFEFVMTSSDYLVRKPDRLLFDIALQKAGLSADEVWYCGDNPQDDIEGASQAGIYPVWYDNIAGKDHADGQHPQCTHLHIHEWDELTTLLEKLKNS